MFLLPELSRNNNAMLDSAVVLLLFRLLLVTAWCTTTASLLELASLWANVWFGVGVWHTGSSAEVTACFTGVALALDQDCVVSGRWQECQLIECQHFSASLGDSLTSAFSDTESANSQFWDLKKTQVVGDASNNDDDVAFLSLAGLDQATDALKRDDWSVDARHKQTLEDDFVELLMCTAVQEAIELKSENKKNC